MTDFRINRIASASVFAALLAALILPLGESGRIVAAILLLPSAVLCHVLIKKRNILSIHKRSVFAIITVIAVLWVMLYYLSGLEFGFYINPFAPGAKTFFGYMLPNALTPQNPIHLMV